MRFCGQAYKWRAKMIFVRPGRKRGADAMSRPCEKVVSRTLKSVPQSQNYTLSQCYAQVWSLCIIQRLQVLGWCHVSHSSSSPPPREVVRLQNQHRRIVLLGRDFFRLYTCNQRLYLYLRMYWWPSASTGGNSSEGDVCSLTCHVYLTHVARM